MDTPLNSALVQQQLAKAGIKARVDCLDQTDSTNRALWQSLPNATDPPERLGQIDHLVLADQQSNAYGRYGRSWHSPAGVNLYISLHFCCQPEPAPGLWVLAAAVAARQALAALLLARGDDSHDQLMLKWPNDIVAGPCKLAGLMLETRLRGGGLNDAVLGVGLNVNMSSADVPPGSVGRPWTSLRQLAKVVFSRSEVSIALVQAWQQAFFELEGDGAGSFLRRWQEHDSLYEREIWVENTVGHKPARIHGTYQGLDSSGQLRLLSHDGVRLFHSADVSLSTEPQS